MDQAWPSSPLPARSDQLLGARKVKRRGPGVGVRWNGWKDGCGGARGQVGERHLSGRPSDAGDRACRPVESTLRETTRHDEEDAQEARERAARMGRRSSETATAHGETFEAFRRSPGRVRARDAQTGRARPGQPCAGTRHSVPPRACSRKLHRGSLRCAVPSRALAFLFAHKVRFPTRTSGDIKFKHRNDPKGKLPKVPTETSRSPTLPPGPAADAFVRFLQHQQQQ
ncbi:hypothetical protein VTN00DRAFT_6869 [Thermoascus crustaceus]|uniref:uncharacterized protein n=1 Tax=Thermoascus crustaceus TaxID=5088 RepID=UPI003742D3C5